MKQKLIRLALALSAMAFVAGCESDRLQRSDASPGIALPPVERDVKYGDDVLLSTAAAQPPGIVDEGARRLFDGQSLSGWRITPFSAAGPVELKSGLVILRKGQPFTGIGYTNPIPATNYEVSLDAMRVSGDDFFCGLTFPVRDSFCSFIMGGWGGSLVGLSSLDGSDASENETTKFINFENGRWYHVRLRVTEHKVEAWIEQKKVVNVVTTGRKLTVRFGEIEQSKPFGIAAWNTTAALREIRFREVSGPASED